MPRTPAPCRHERPNTRGSNDSDRRYELPNIGGKSPRKLAAQLQPRITPAITVGDADNAGIPASSADDRPFDSAHNVEKRGYLPAIATRWETPTGSRISRPRLDPNKLHSAAAPDRIRARSTDQGDDRYRIRVIVYRSKDRAFSRTTPLHADCRARSGATRGRDAAMIIGMDVWAGSEIVLRPPPPYSHTYGTTPTKQSCPISEDEQLRVFLEEEVGKFDHVRGPTELIEHRVKLVDPAPIKQRYRPRNPAMQAIIDAEVDQMLQDGIIEPSTSAWSSPIVVVRKKDGKNRFCIDFPQVNSVTERDAYPLPQISATLDKLRGARYLSTIDLKNGYWQVPLAASSRPITAFTVPGQGLMHFRVMPFGLHSAPATFQRLLDRVIGPELEPHAFAYLDDIIVASRTFAEYLQHLREVFRRLRAARLRINRDKCRFCVPELRYLGHIVNRDGIKTDPEKTTAIADWPTPQTVKHIRQFLGVASWYRRFIKNFATVAAPLTTLTRKNTRWKWGEEEQGAFDALKNNLTTAPVLACPDFERPFTLQTDASTIGLGVVLTQYFPEGERVIAYASRTLNGAEKNYSATELECLAVVWGIRKMRGYLEGYRFTVITDHQALKWLQQLESPSGRLGRWMFELQQYAFEIRYRKGALNRVADALSRQPAVSAISHPRCQWYRRTWDRFAFNTASNDATGYSPAYLNLGREPCSVVRSNEATVGPSKPDALRQRLEDAYELVRVNLARAFQQQARNYDLRRRDWQPKLGEWVWKRDHPLSSKSDAFNAKLAPRYIGPLEVKAAISPVIYDLRSKRGKWHRHVHLQDLKLSPGKTEADSAAEIANDDADNEPTDADNRPTDADRHHQRRAPGNRNKKKGQTAGCRQQNTTTRPRTTAEKFQAGLKINNG
ncbi:uncharacterized protein LOC112552444 [Pogonomyrmex barbatus]|uniref:RNA-directed DNA polymerase n=1 Tax=Pogonomyrmex barbatus TaxID=144034 RepID=A0A8N1S3R5_9HYME|nr:uncharacterized protein LOC112552444 [Pogonomyrmex barbatus]